MDFLDSFSSRGPLSPEDALEYLCYLRAKGVAPSQSTFEEWKAHRGPSGMDPREIALRELDRDRRAKRSPAGMSIRHQYTLPPRMSGTIYDKLTHAARRGMAGSLVAPPDIWFTSWGGSVDYANGTLHFPKIMPPGLEDELSSYTIRRQKLDARHYLFLAAQLEQERRAGRAPAFYDSALGSIADILAERKPVDCKPYTPRKIVVAQTKELLHAWVSVYAFKRIEHKEILEYYLYAGYVVTMTRKCGGVHKK